MIPRLVRRQPVVLLAVVGIVGVVLYDLAFVRSDNFAGYWTSTVSNASIFLIFSCAVSSAGAALAAGRARRGGLWATPAARKRSTLAFTALSPALLAGLVVQFSGLAVLIPPTIGAPGRIPFEMFFAWVAILVFHCALGFVLGRFLPMVASIPVAIFLSYCWLGFTWSVDYYPIRYLAGLVMVDCCSVDTVLDTRAIVAVIVFSVIGAAALLCTAVAPPLDLGRAKTAASWAVTVLGVIGAAVGGLHVAADLGPQPLRDRPSSEQRCEGSGPVVCLYPQQTAEGDPRTVLHRATTNLAAAGVHVPGRIEGSRGRSSAAVLRMVVAPHTSTPVVIESLAASLLPDDLAPYCGDGSDYPQRVDDAVVASWWLSSVAGRGQISEDAIRPIASSADTTAMIERFSHLTAAEQRSWYRSAMPALRSCDRAPVEVPTP
ncbi:hypothetical protein [Curtobacterium herbarum]|uniref:DUF7224 domain-containing protein n=1 Tax=Curtobacterium herbarum TaxID=150122 RepID=UPI00217EE4E5|nr:hypothetical protein [Curtobacterium herbarum]MCS6543570.1 hypothetical protein [Curtobacterium herbarum]